MLPHNYNSNGAAPLPNPLNSQNASGYQNLIISSILFRHNLLNFFIHIRVVDVRMLLLHNDEHVLVAQLDRALASEAKGRWFDSSQARNSFFSFCIAVSSICLIRSAETLYAAANS